MARRRDRGAFREDGAYTRREIHAALGGGMRECLPHRDGEVVAGCFRPGLNPDAPEVVLLAAGESDRWSAVLAVQRTPVPVFLQDGPGSWRFKGRYRVRRRTTNRREVQRHARKAERTDVTTVLLLRRA